MAENASFTHLKICYGMKNSTQLGTGLRILVNFKKKWLKKIFENVCKGVNNLKIKFGCKICQPIPFCTRHQSMIFCFVSGID